MTKKTTIWSLMLILILSTLLAPLTTSATTLLNIKVGERIKLETNIYLPSLDKEAEGLKIAWSSSDSSVASIDFLNNITGKSPGLVTMIGKVNNVVVANFQVQVTSTVTGVQVDKSEIHMKIGDIQKLSATVLPSDAVMKSVTWSSSNPTVARVSSFGSITAFSEGKTTITATTKDGGFTATTEVTVSAIEEEISVSETEIAVKIGEAKPLELNLGTSTTTTPKFTYEIADKTIANVDYKGRVVGLKEGETTVTVKSSTGQSKTITVKVISDVTELKMLDANGEPLTTIDLKVGEPFQLYADGSPDSLENYKIQWTSKDREIATIDTRGVVKGLKEGTATITFTLPQESTPLQATLTVNVQSTVEGVEIVQKDVKLVVGETKRLEAVVFPETAYLKSVTWRSSNSSIAMVNSNGDVKGMREGTATISAITKDGQKVATTTVTVDSLAEGIHVSTTDVKVYMGDTATFTAFVHYPDEAMTSDIGHRLLTTDGYSIVSISKSNEEGVYTYTLNGLKPGVTTLQLTAKDGSFVKEISVEVMETPVQVEIYDPNGVKLN